MKKIWEIYFKLLIITLLIGFTINLTSCKTNKDVRQVGVDWAIQQSKELLDAGVPFLHYYSMGKSDNIKKIASAIF